MAGQAGENPIANAVFEGRIGGFDGAWQMVAERVESVPGYRRQFSWIIGANEPIHVADIARALADFITYEFRATDSPFDAFLKGDDTALENGELRGMSLFYGKAGCAACHSGPLQTDHGFHAIGLPQLGPGKGHGPGYADHGRAAVTGQPQDMYRFRTPSLRNVTVTAPYGHSGAYSDLGDMVRHHLDAATALAEYLGTSRAFLPNLGEAMPADPAMADFDEVLRIGAAIGIAPVVLSEDEIASLLDFLQALTDPASLLGRLGPPESVPSGLPADPAEPPS